MRGVTNVEYRQNIIKDISVEEAIDLVYNRHGMAREHDNDLAEAALRLVFEIENLQKLNEEYSDACIRTP